MATDLTVPPRRPYRPESNVRPLPWLVALALVSVGQDCDRAKAANRAVFDKPAQAPEPATPLR